MATENHQAQKQYKSTQRTLAASTAEALPTTPPPDKPEWAEPQIKFSIIFPSRERIPLLTQLFLSIMRTTRNLKEIEVLVAVDQDDFKTFKFLTEANLDFVKIWQVPRSKNFSRDYYTFLAKESKGRWIITANDDCVFETDGWDEIAYRTLCDKSGVIYGWIEDELGGFRAQGHGDYCCFPLQGRKGFEALGYIFPARIPTWGADIWAKNLYDQIDSVVRIPITLRHHCHHNKTREQDDINKRIAHMQVPFDMRVTYEELNKLIEAKKKERVKV